MGISAVSNWRKRFDDFPRPVEGAPGGRDHFDLGEVETWLRKRGRLKQGSWDKQLLYEAAELLRGQLDPGSTIEALGAALALVAVGRRQTEQLPSGLDAEAAVARLVAAEPASEDALRPLLEIDRAAAGGLIDLVSGIEEPLSDAFEWLLSRYGQQQRLAHHSSAEKQIALLGALTEGEGEVAYDPAVGWGGLLRALWSNAPQIRKPKLLGQEINGTALRIARQRFLIEGISFTGAGGNTLIEDAWPNLRADLVVANPPFGLKQEWPKAGRDDHRWRYGKPLARGDFAWLQHCLHHLGDAGRAYVFLPSGSLFRAGEEGEIRRRMLEEGVVEAIFALPPGSALGTSLPLVLWVLGRPIEHRSHVLLVDMAATDSTGDAPLDVSISRVASVWQEWRSQERVSPSDRDVAASVASLELAAEAANLVPARWMNYGLTETQRRRQEADFEELAAKTRQSRRALGGELELPPPSSFSCLEWVSVKRLADEERVKFVKGSRIEAGDLGREGIPVLRAQDLSQYAGQLKATVRLPEETARRSLTLTNPGDVVLSPASGSLKAAVDTEGGHLLVRPLQGLRILDGSMDPEVVAAFLESPRNRRFVTGSAYARVSLRDLELPLLEPEAAEALRVVFDQLREQEALTADLLASARKLRSTAANLTTPVAGKGDAWTRST
ncbi:MAG TPA: N-6 DNA methylase [Solirubrobacterales bacterium]|nr:N-6 DNA methylase [Solirubrobacterales bacterium]